MENITLQKGQYWYELNPRIEGMRIVEIIDIRGDLVRIKTILLTVGPAATSGYVTWTFRDRFNGKPHGFKFMPPLL